MQSLTLFSRFHIVAFACLSLLYSGAASAIKNASPHAIKEQQPDGTVIELRIHGDEHFHWLEDPAGYTVVHTDRLLLRHHG